MPVSGYPIKELYVWIVDDPTGEHGIVAAAVGKGGFAMQAVTSRRRTAEQLMRPIAEDAKQATGRPVKLQRFKLVETIETL